MIELSKNSSFNLFYQSSEHESNLTVVLDMWKDTGEKIQDNLGAEGEICNQGIYQFTCTAPDYDGYILIKISDGLDEINTTSSPFIFQVGSPLNAKLFYANETFEEDLNLPFEIFDSQGIVHQSGVLSHIVNGFYETSVSGLNGTFYFKVLSNIELVEL